MLELTPETSSELHRVGVTSPTNYRDLPIVDSDHTPALYTFSKQALSNLSPFDQLLFERFGQGPITPVPYTCIHHAFEARAAANPQAIAAHHLDDSITYQTLDRQANRLAALLALHGVSPGDNVALFLQRSIPMLVGILAALKVGAAYVPQHAGVAPEAHLRYIIDVTSAKVILTLSSLRHLVPVSEGHICIAIDEVMQEPFLYDSDHVAPFTPNAKVGRDDTCFILFTSGTTGTPNGEFVIREGTFEGCDSGCTGGPQVTASGSGLGRPLAT